VSDEQQHDPRVSTIPLDTEDGDEVVIEQQNAGPGQQVGAGEFKPSDETSVHKDPGDAAAEQERLEREAPIDGE
jgi:hypothetical protein